MNQEKIADKFTNIVVNPVFLFLIIFGIIMGIVLLFSEIVLPMLPDNTIKDNLGGILAGMFSQ